MWQNGNWIVDLMMHFPSHYTSQSMIGVKWYYRFFSGNWGHIVPGPNHVAFMPRGMRPHFVGPYILIQTGPDQTHVEWIQPPIPRPHTPRLPVWLLIAPSQCITKPQPHPLGLVCTPSSHSQTLPPNFTKSLHGLPNSFSQPPSVLPNINMLGFQPNP